MANKTICIHLFVTLFDLVLNVPEKKYHEWGSLPIKNILIGEDTKSKI